MFRFVIRITNKKLNWKQKIYWEQTTPLSYTKYKGDFVIAKSNLFYDKIVDGKWIFPRE